MAHQKSRNRNLALVAVLLLCATAANGQELVPNGTFDSDVAGWTIEIGGGSFVWDGTNGLPPGSLSASGGATVATTDCFPRTSGNLRLNADVFRQGPGDPFTCALAVYWYFSDDCSGMPIEPAGPGGVDIPSAELFNAWEPLADTVPQIPDFGSFRPILLTTASPNPGDACLYDNVSAVALPSTIDVPAISKTGAILLGLLVAGAALLFLRRAA